MALFGTTKNTSTKAKAKKGKVVVRHRTRSTATTNGVAHDIIRAPWFSEKALIVTEKGIYTFDVSERATKASIASAIKEIYKVEPRKIRIVNLPGKPKTMRTKRGVGHRASRRKAYVYLNAGDTIQFS